MATKAQTAAAHYVHRRFDPLGRAGGSVVAAPLPLSVPSFWLWPPTNESFSDCGGALIVPPENPYQQLPLAELARRAKKLAAPYRVTSGKGFRLRDFDPADTGSLKSQDKPKAKTALEAGVEALSKLQERLYAQDRWAVLLIFQAMDAAGKDSAIKHVMSGVNPQGVQVVSFKAPSHEDLDHDFFWRCARHLPERGRIGIFNRSYYEETLVVRVHPEILEAQRLPPQLVTDALWEERFQSIRHFEKHLARNGVAICKFFLHVSKKEQLARFLSRLDEPDKNWKFSQADVAERKHWRSYMRAYEQTIAATAAKHAPWYVVPADNKWFTRVVVAAAIIDTLWSLNLEYPVLDDQQKQELERLRELLMGGDGKAAAEEAAAGEAEAAAKEDASQHNDEEDEHDADGAAGSDGDGR